MCDDESVKTRGEEDTEEERAFAFLAFVVRRARSIADLEYIHAASCLC